MGHLSSLVLAALLGAAPTPPNVNEGLAMQEFALIFRARRPLAGDELQRRNTAAREWAMALRREGVLRYASPLEDEALTVTQEGVVASFDEPRVAGVLIIAAPDLESMLARVKKHPGLPFGTSIEVRALRPGVGAQLNDNAPPRN